MSQGYIKLYRQIQDHKFWRTKRVFSKAEAWIDILLMVNHADKTVLLGNENITVKAGSRITSIRELCDRWQWSNTKVKSFINFLEVEKMLVAKSDTKKTVITVINWALYQNETTVKTTRKRHENDTKTTRKHTNNNEKNDKNEKNIKEIILTPDESEFINELNLIEQYPIDRKKDTELYHALVSRYPSIDVLSAVKDWRIHKLSNPLQPNQNPRSQLNTWCQKAQEWGKNKKVVNIGVYDKYKTDIYRG